MSWLRMRVENVLRNASSAPTELFTGVLAVLWGVYVWNWGHDPSQRIYAWLDQIFDVHIWASFAVVGGVGQFFGALRSASFYRKAPAAVLLFLWTFVAIGAFNFSSVVTAVPVYGMLAVIEFWILLRGATEERWKWTQP